MAMSTVAAAAAMHGDVEVEMRYLDPRAKGNAEAALSRPEPGGARADSIPVRVIMRDARKRPEQTLAVRDALERTGFALATLDPDELAELTSFDPFTMETDKAAAQRYKDVMARVVRRIMGASWGRSTGLVLRKSGISGVHTRARGDDAPRGPVNDVHCDFTPDSNAIGMYETLAKHVGLHGCRYSVVNAWRNVSRDPVSQWPMAVIDSSTVSQDDLVPRVTPENGNTIYNVLANSKHKWFTFPAMAPNEILLFKQYDSDPSAPVRFTPHTAFNHPRTSPDAPERQSCEVRVLCFFDRDLRCGPALRALHAAGSGVVDPAVLTEDCEKARL